MLKYLLLVATTLFPSTLYGQFEILVSSRDSVKLVDASGNVSTFASGFGFVTAIGITPNGDVLIGDNRLDLVSRFSGDGQLVGEFADLSGEGVAGMDVDANGNVLIIPDNGVHVNRFNSDGSIEELPTGVNGSEVLADLGGGFLVADSNHDAVWRFDDAGNATGVAAELDFANYLAFDQQGSLYVTQGFGFGDVYRFHTDGLAEGVFASGGLSDAAALEFAPDGTFFVADKIQANIRRFSGDGSDMGIFAIAIGGGVAMAIRTVPHCDTLEDLELLAGDFDGDGEVAFDDFLVLSSNFGLSVEDYRQGDTNCDGMIDFDDFLSLSQNFGANPDSVLAVPEPDSVFVTLLAFAIAGCVGRARSAARVSVMLPRDRAEA